MRQIETILNFNFMGEIAFWVSVLTNQVFRYDFRRIEVKNTCTASLQPAAFHLCGLYGLHSDVV
jgi:hypothetical protein